MKTIDMRFNEELIKSWIGLEFKKYKCDPFDFSNSITQLVGLFIGEQAYTLTNIQETLDYYGNTEDIAIFKLTHTNENNIKSAFIYTSMIDTPIKGIIKSIKIINENQRITEQGAIKYDTWFTRAIIFTVDDREISFEKDTVPFSEEIIIRKGYNLVNDLASEKAFLEGWDDGIIPECRRQIIDISK